MKRTNTRSPKERKDKENKGSPVTGTPRKRAGSGATERLTARPPRRGKGKQNTSGTEFRRNGSALDAITAYDYNAIAPQNPVKAPRGRKGKNTDGAVGGVEKPIKTIKNPKQSTAKGRTKKVAPQEVVVNKQAEVQKVETPAKTTGKKGKGKKPIRILFLGGVGEIGKNMTAIEFGNDIIVIDAGVTFPDEEMPGVDLVVPDASYLVERKDNIKGILLTHGHEDHIGGLAYLLKQLNPKTPVYGTKLTLALADNKIREHKLQNVNFKTVKPRDIVKLGVFSVEFIGVTHSIAGAVALAIRTPYGIIYHSGDFKIDMTPVAGEPIDLHRIAQLGQEGVLLYMGESTNIERAGYTMSETVVGTTLDHLFAEHASRRLVIATFASNVHRLQQIIDLAVKYKRKVALSGRSMLNVVEAASKIGEISIPEGVLVDVERARNYFDREIVIVSTGSQGEPMSALTRMASGEFNKVNIGENDTVIISASPIPGNEKMVYRVINNLYKKGAKVVYASLENIHVSGHACREEHKIIHTLLAPKFFIPVHGEYRHLKLHGDLACELGMPRSNVFLPDIGNVACLTDTLLSQGDNFPAGSMIIDGTGSEDFNTSEVIRDRKKIASEGMLVVSLTVSGGEVISTPSIENIGILFGDERDYEKELKSVVLNAIGGYGLINGDAEGLKQAIVKMLKGYLYKKTKKSPHILAVVMEV